MIYDFRVGSLVPLKPIVIPGRVGDNPPTSTLYYGIDVREALKLFPDQSIQVIATSPPYFGLRDYGTDPLIWGGDPTCGHDWSDSSVVRKGSTNGRADLGSTIVSVGGPKTLAPGLDNDVGETHQHRRDVSTSCSKCGAWKGSLGLEPTPDLFVEHLVEVFREARRVLREDGIFWLNLGDSYWTSKGTPGGEHQWQQGLNADLKNPARRFGKRPQDGSPPLNSGIKAKDLVGIPWMVAFALRADGWYLRQDVIWAKPNCMPESVADRCTKAHEYVFMLTKSPRYFYDTDAIRETSSVLSVSVARRDRADNGMVGSSKLDGRFAQSGSGLNTEYKGSTRNRRSVWTVNTKPYKGAHFACWPEALVEPMIKAGTSEKGSCSSCGTPWERTMTSREPTSTEASAGGDPARNDGGTRERAPAGSGGGNVLARTRIPSGWEPGCTCTSPTRRCVVLDPFSGSATTGVVANRLDHDYIGIDLNAEYLPLAERRLRGISEMSSQEEPEEVEEDIFTLFKPQ